MNKVFESRVMIGCSGGFCSDQVLSHSEFTALEAGDFGLLAEGRCLQSGQDH